jgi:hypothetical protein
MDLGVIEAGQKAVGTIVVGNLGEKRFSLLPQVGIRQAMASLKAPLVVPPGDSVQMPFEVDAHGLEGPTELVLEVRTNDPGQPMLKQRLSFTVVNSTWVRPLRDGVFATADSRGIPIGEPASFEFMPGPTSGSFASVALEDATAPLVLSFVKTATGGIHGTISIDQAAILHGAAKQGETRLLGVTANGNQNFITFQWWVKAL